MSDHSCLLPCACDDACVTCDAFHRPQLVALRREDAKSKKNIRDLEGKLHGVKEALSRKADAAAHGSSVSSASNPGGGAR